MNAEFLGALEDLERERGINKEVLLEAIEAALISAYRRHFGQAQNVRVHIDRETGEPRVYAVKTVVDRVTDDRLEVSLAVAREQDPTVKIGDVVEYNITPKAFSRIAAQTAKQVVMQRIREAERGLIYQEFSSREGDIVTGVIQRVEPLHDGGSRDLADLLRGGDRHPRIFLDLGRTEAILRPSDQVPTERLRSGDRVKAYVVEVKKTTKGPEIYVSRSHPGLLKRLFEMEVPEIHDGIVEIKGIAREAGYRSKVSVWSDDPNVDPVGACVGPRGMRVQAIVNEIQGEKLDIIRWDPDPVRLVANALSPAKVTSVTVDPETRVARVVVPDYQLSLAIGKDGQNARLAAKLTGWKIDIRSESQAEGGNW
ncbi:MAG: transcription termination factor NusA [Actinomycetia bacterium]|nr:transcription termination factor NusA [Actinomycetes bacterium]